MIQGLGQSRSTVAGVTVDRNVPMQTRDGTRLRADVYRPLHSDRDLPVLLLRSPYGKGNAHDGTYMHPAWYARQGFIVAFQDVRGRHSSDGTFTAWQNERKDGYDAVEWAAKIAGSNGNVGMYGASYLGMVQLLAASERPPSLRAIAPAMTSIDLYRWCYEGGAFRPSWSWWASTLAINEAERRGDAPLAVRLRALAGAPDVWLASAQPSALEPLEELTPYYTEWLAHPEFDDFWRRLGSPDDLGSVDVPALHVVGWFDVFVSAALEAYGDLARRRPTDQHLIVGPWAHYPWGRQVGDRRFSEAANGTNVIDQVQVRFFRHHLDDGEPLDFTARYFVIGADEWVTTDTWPPRGVASRSMYLDSDGGANSSVGTGRLLDDVPGDQPPDIYNYSGIEPIPTLGGHSCCAPGANPMGMVDQTPLTEHPDVLVYTSDPLPEDLVLTGPVSVELYVSSDALSGDYVAILCYVDACGTWNLVEGMSRCSVGTASAAEEPHRVDIALQSTAVHIPAGNQIRLLLAGGSFPSYDRNPQTGAPPAFTPLSEYRSAMHAIHHSSDFPSRVVFTTIGRA